MGLLERLVGRRRQPRLLKLRFTRFGQLLSHRGRLIELAADAREKQLAEFVFDRQYLHALLEAAVALADAVVFDLNVMTEGASLAFYDRLGRLASDAERLLSETLGGAVEPGGEENEDRALRSLSAALFTPTLPPGRPPRAAAPADCGSLLDLVEIAHLAAGESLAAVMEAEARQRGLESGSGVLALPLLGDGADGTALAPLLDHLTAPRAATVLATGHEQRGCLAFLHAGGLDLVDVVLDESRAGSRLYCRFSPRYNDGDDGGRRGRLAAEVLARLDLGTPAAGRGVTGWCAGLSGKAARDRLAVIGKMMEWLEAEREPAGQRPPEESAREFVRRAL